jgi:predicted DNA-binding protein
MIRTQIQLTDEQAARLRRVAAERGVSIAALIREAIDASLSEPELEQRHSRALAAIGRFRSGRGGIAEQHDQELERIYHD